MRWQKQLSLVAVPVLIASACRYDATAPVSTSAVTEGQAERAFPSFTESSASLAASLPVANVDQLYAAVNDAANAGTDILLSPGIYVLGATDGAGAARPNGGRLELQPNMSLYGVTGDRSAVVIDASALPASAFNVSFGRTAPVRIGRGSNGIEWLTIVGNAAAAAGIATELTGTPTTHVRVAHVLAGGSSRGIDIRNVGVPMIGRQINADVIDNEFVGPSEVVGMTEGIRLANFVAADQGVIVATLAGNRAHGFQVGLIVANNRSSNATIEVRSTGDRFFGNALGALITGGLSQATTGFANSNTTTFLAHGTQFEDNTAEIPGIDRGGMRVVAGLSTVKADATSNNTLKVELWGSKTTGNEPIDFEAFGAWKASPPGIAGTNNRATVTLHGVSRQIDGVVMSSFPTDAGGTNSVTVIR
jgi:hypothetical protein